jgi:hypothetical protein
MGIVGLVLGIACAAAAFAALSKVLNTADETGHMDYAFQVWHGHLPVFERGVVFKPPTASIPPAQWEAQHPPLFYLLLAPVVGPLIDGGHWLQAVLAGRAVCVLIAVACVLALSWAGSLVSTRRRAAWAIAVPAVVAPFSPFMRVGGSVYNDNLAAFFSILALGIAMLAVRRGVNRRLVVAAALVAAAGMLSRATFVLTLLVLAGALVLGVWIHENGALGARLVRSAVVAAIPFAAAVGASGWFYQRNEQLTGTYTGGHAEWAAQHLGRESKPFTQVLTSSGFWKTNLQVLRQTGGLDGRLGPYLLALTASVAGVVWLLHLARRHGKLDRIQAAVVLVLAAQFLGALIVEIGYVATGGGVITRYLLPALLPFGCLLATAVVGLPRILGALGLLGYLMLAWGFFLHWTWVQPIVNGSHLTGRTANNIRWSIVLIALVGLGVGVLLQVWAFSRVSAPSPQPRRRMPKSSNRRPSNGCTTLRRDSLLSRAREGAVVLAEAEATRSVLPFPLTGGADRQGELVEGLG